MKTLLRTTALILLILAPFFLGVFSALVTGGFETVYDRADNKDVQRLTANGYYIVYGIFGSVVWLAALLHLRVFDKILPLEEKVDD